MKIKSIHVWTDGCDELNIPAKNVTITADSGIIADTGPIGLDCIMGDIEYVFDCMWGITPHVKFDFEMDNKEVL